MKAVSERYRVSKSFATLFSGSFGTPSRIEKIKILPVCWRSVNMMSGVCSRYVDEQLVGDASLILMVGQQTNCESCLRGPRRVTRVPSFSPR